MHKRVKMPVLMLMLCCITETGNAAAYAPAELKLSDAYSSEAASAVPRRSERPWFIETRRYSVFGAAEWRPGVKREAGEEPEVLHDVNSADFVVVFPSPNSITLHWSKGSHAETSDFEPREQGLDEGAPIALKSFGGRSSDGVMPYFAKAHIIWHRQSHID